MICLLYIEGNCVFCWGIRAEELRWQEIFLFSGVKTSSGVPPTPNLFFRGSFSGDKMAEA